MLKVGDKVRIKRDLQLHEIYFIEGTNTFVCVWRKLYEGRGIVTTVTSIDEDGTFQTQYFGNYYLHRDMVDVIWKDKNEEEE